MKGELVFLGTGASAGVPIIGCACEVCTSTNSRNKRLRPSVLLRLEGKQILVDAGPDIREQALRYKIDHLDGVILTHAHYDHIGGLDDLRGYFFVKHQPIPCLTSQETYAEVTQRMPYLFRAREEGLSMPVQLDFQVLNQEFGDVSFLDLSFHIVSYEQGGQKVIGFRLGDLAFISDICNYSQRVIEDIKGVKTLIVSALRERSSPVHFNFAKATAFAQEVGAEQTWFTHIAHEADHEKSSQGLPPNVALAYDGLTLHFSGDRHL